MTHILYGYMNTYEHFLSINNTDTITLHPLMLQFFNATEVLFFSHAFSATYNVIPFLHFFFKYIKFFLGYYQSLSSHEHVHVLLLYMHM